MKSKNNILVFILLISSLTVVAQTRTKNKTKKYIKSISAEWNRIPYNETLRDSISFNIWNNYHIYGLSKRFIIKYLGKPDYSSEDKKYFAYYTDPESVFYNDNIKDWIHEGYTLKLKFNYFNKVNFIIVTH